MQPFSRVPWLVLQARDHQHDLRHLCGAFEVRPGTRPGCGRPRSYPEGLAREDAEAGIPADRPSPRCANEVTGLSDALVSETIPQHLAVIGSSVVAWSWPRHSTGWAAG